MKIITNKELEGEYMLALDDDTYTWFDRADFEMVDYRQVHLISCDVRVLTLTGNKATEFCRVWRLSQ